jgi:hypothetical protein
MQQANEHSATRLPEVCYLCGESLPENDRSKDHVPPKQFYAKEIRLGIPLNLLTLETHAACNRSFQRDEDFVVNTLLPFVLTSTSGAALGQDVAAMVRKGKQRKLIQKIIEEFEERPSGLILPPERIVKRIEYKRIHRVAWKIIRGLFFHHHEKMLPEDTPHKLIEMIMPGDGPGKYLPFIVDQSSQGAYPGVFDYKIFHCPQLQKWPNVWALLLWDRVILIEAFQNPLAALPSC